MSMKIKQVSLKLMLLGNFAALHVISGHMECCPISVAGQAFQGQLIHTQCTISHQLLTICILESEGKEKWLYNP